MTTQDLQQRLRAYAQGAYDDLALGDEAAEALARLEAENDRLLAVVKLVLASAGAETSPVLLKAARTAIAKATGAGAEHRKGE